MTVKIQVGHSWNVQWNCLLFSFLPDFTQVRYEAGLQFYTDDMDFPYFFILAATVPKEWIPKCQSALPRPPWEAMMYYVSVTALVFLLVFTIASAYLEGDRAITVALREQRLKELKAQRSQQVFSFNPVQNPRPQTRPENELKRFLFDFILQFYSNSLPLFWGFIMDP